jgi:S1-C subfamily serine protease
VVVFRLAVLPTSRRRFYTFKGTTMHCKRCFLTLVAILCSVESVKAQDYAELIEVAERSVIRIDVKGVGQGSGFVVGPTGIACTNVHVMAGAKNDGAIATFPNGERCKITGSYHIDEGRDIAIIQLDLTSVTSLQLAKNLPRKGEEVIALGSPMGLSFTATRGIVSAIRSEEEMRSDLGDRSMRGTWVQVDASLSPGNSGGPLLNFKGECVAMSTRASFGKTQNLNFGISINDILQAIEDAKSKPLVALSDGLGKVDMIEVNPPSGSLVERVEIPESAIVEYAERGLESFDDMAKQIRREVTSQTDLLKMMKQGRIDISLGNRVAREVATGKFLFGSEGQKNTIITRQEERVRDLTRVRDSIGKQKTKDSLFSLLWHAGPRLDTRRKGNVGFMSEGIVIIALGEHDVVVDIAGVDCLMWVKDTTGLDSGQPVTPTPVYVVGTQTVNAGATRRTVTVLNSVLETELRKAVESMSDSKFSGGSSKVAETDAATRTWKDNSGKFEIEATLVTSDAKQVVLKKTDGSIITVPIDKLSDSDQRFLKKK